MFGRLWTALVFGILGWLATALLVAKPIEDAAAFVFLYGGMLSFTVFGLCWNLFSLWLSPLPRFIETIRVPWVAFGLGINTACRNAYFANGQGTASMVYVITQFWIAIEVLLAAALLVGLRPWTWFDEQNA